MRPLIVHRFICHVDSDIIITSMGKMSFIKDQFYHSAKYVLPDGKVDETHAIVIGIFWLPSGEMKELKPFIKKEDCKKYLTHKP